MSIGDGIFLSAVLLSVVGLFAATKDRWNWRRVLRWVIGLPVALGALLAAGLWAYSKYEDRPVAQVEFEGLRLAATPADVRFLKGEPIQRHSTEDRWVFSAHSSSGEPEDAVLIVQFREGKLRHVTYWANERQIVRPYLLGFSLGSDYEAVLQKLGAPSNVSTSVDGLTRLLSFARYNVFFEFERGRVRSFGIFDSATGPVRFNKESDEAASAPR